MLFIPQNGMILGRPDFIAIEHKLQTFTEREREREREREHEVVRER